jgi:murein DD-endopeptidase MepM/ murein hydrolase activator NlpD
LILKITFARKLSFSDKIRQFLDRLREKHKLIFINDTNYHEKWSLRVSALNLYTLLILYTILIFFGFMLLFKYTPFSAFFATNESNATQALVEKNTRSLDSLYQMTASTEKYLADLKRLLNGESFDDSVYQRKIDTTFVAYTPDFTRSLEDSILRAKVEQQNPAGNFDEGEQGFDFFFPPVNGTVSQSFNPAKSHFGVDVVTSADEPVKACLDGTAIVSGWVPGEGNILVIQHNNDLVSVYKHCSVLLKSQGDKIMTGDPVGIVGNTGENTTGPHLHFELWKQGIAINPQEYISF